MLNDITTSEDMKKLPDINILDEKDKILHKPSKPVKFPLSDYNKKRIKDMITYLTMSQIEPIQEKYELRAGMGLSAVQIGIPERFFVIVDEYEEGKFKDYIIINPEIISYSEEQIYVGEGEGCLSVNRPVDGIVPRYARITVEAYDMNGKKFRLRVREDIAIAFQHEIDHLNGILFVDKIDPKHPFKDSQNMREI